MTGTDVEPQDPATLLVDLEAEVCEGPDGEDSYVSDGLGIMDWFADNPVAGLLCDPPDISDHIVPDDWEPPSFDGPSGPTFVIGGDGWQFTLWQEVELAPLYADGVFWANLLASDSRASWTAFMATLTTAPDPPELRCHEWTDAVRAFVEAVTGTLEYYGLLHRGSVMRLALESEGGLLLEWQNDRSVPAGVLVVAPGARFGGACGRCPGCRAVVTCHEKSAATYVYAIRAGDHIKIGYSNNPEARLAALQTGNPHRLELLLKVPGGPALERALHVAFADARVRADGEWFRCTSDLARLIAELRG